MTLENIKSELIEVVEQKLPLAFDKLSDVLSKDSIYFKVPILQSSIYHTLFIQQLEGVIGQEDYRVELQRIKYALLETIGSLTKGDLKTLQTDVSEAQLEAFMNELALAPMPKISLVNCNRDQAIADFETFFYEREDQPYQFYFITASNDQEPDSFAERLVYEIAGQTDNAIAKAAIDYKRIEEPLPLSNKTVKVERVFTEPLPLGRVLKASQRAFRQYLSERLIPHQMDNLTLEEFISEAAKRLEYRYMMFNFIFDAAEWNAATSQYITWLIETFKQNIKTEPTFIFTFVINIETEENSETAFFKTELDTIIAQHSDSSVKFQPFESVAAQLVKSWLNNKARIRNNDDINTILQTYSAILAQKGIQGNSFAMQHIERLQAMAYVASRQKIK
jgi:hypothetical protein